MGYYNQYEPTSKEMFKISRTKIELFLNCQRCFYLNQRLGIKEPSGYPFNLNSAVDHLLKKEFDIHRAKGVAHPLMKAYGLDAVPYSHPDLDKWRYNFTGVQYVDKKNNFLIYGAVDDVWVNPKRELIVVDYKATSKDGEVSLDAEWQMGYKRQMEVYQWLLRKNGFKVSETGYFVYCNGRKSSPAFDGKLEFDVKLIPYKGDDGWIEDTIDQIKVCLNSDSIPSPTDVCELCQYVEKSKNLK